MHDSIPVSAQDAMSPQTLEVSVNGEWVEVPVLWVDGQPIVIQGTTIRIASMHDEEWLEEELRNPEACLKELKHASRELRADIFSFSQKVPSTESRYGYLMERRSVAVANVSSFENWWESLSQVTRKNVRRSHKRGVTLQVRGLDTDVIRGIMDIQNETPIRQGRRYPHFGKSFEQVKRDHGAFLNRSDFICAYSGEEMIGFLKLVYRGNIASILQLNSKAAHYDKRSSNALMAKAVELCGAKGITHLIYGRFNYGHSDSSLREFKERHGFCEMLVPEYYVPLTAWGRVCVALHLYRGAMHFVPEKVRSLVRNLRSGWYSLRSKHKAGVA
jgi:hypothetical protein